MSATNPSTNHDQVDPRGPRFGATITSVLLLVAIFFSLIGEQLVATVFAIAIALLFAWGAIFGVKRHPWGLLFQSLIRPRLAAPSELEDAAPPRFAQLIGLIVVGIGLLLQLFGIPVGLLIALIAAFIAAGLNASVGFCLGCEIYLLLARAGLIRRNATT